MMMRSIFILSILIIGTLAGLLRSSEKDSAAFRFDLLREGQSLLLDDRFEDADSIFELYSRRYPADPAGSLFRASVLLARMNDAEEDFAGDQLKRMLDSIDAQVEKRLPSSDSSARAWLMLVRGHARSYRSIYESRFGSFLSAVKQGLSARNCYTNGLKYDSSLYDLYLGLGSYHYWKSAKGGVLSLFRILKNEKDRGIRELCLARDSAHFSKEAAHTALIWIYLNEEEYDSVIAIAEYMHDRYPDGRSFLWPLAEAYSKNKRHLEAIEVYRTLRSYFDNNRGNYFNLIEIDFAICRLAEKIKDDGAAGEQAVKGSAYFDHLPEQTQKRQRSKLAFLRRKASQ